MVRRSMLLVLALAASAWGQIRLPAIFGDNMVLQRGARRQIWGWAQPGEEVRVTFWTDSRTTRANDKGEWRTIIEPVDPDQPTTLTVEAPSGKVVFQNVVVGDVWICGGQSNMEWPVARSDRADEALNHPADRDLRLFIVPHRASPEPTIDVQGRWVICDPQTVGDFSAVAYWFGRHIRDQVGVTLGLVQATWGGTPVEAWTPRPALEADRVLSQRLAEWDAREREHHRPAHLFNGMYRPLEDFAKQGFIWYQGESNVGREEEYARAFRALIRKWRPPFAPLPPFYFVQLAGFHAPADQPGDSAWARLREAQASALLEEATGMAVAFDIGDARDIHPRNKPEVGRRLALLALRDVYARTDLVATGPLFKAARFGTSGEVTLTFTGVGSGLESRGGELKGFAIAGADRKWVWAQARIEGDQVIVWSPQVPKPVAVRYAWADNPVATLQNREGLPAAPFRTDRWPAEDRR